MPNIAQDTWRLLTQAPAFAKAGRGPMAAQRQGGGEGGSVAHRGRWGGLLDSAETAEVDELPMACGTGSPLGRTGVRAGRASAQQEDHQTCRTGPNWLAGDLRQADLVAKVDRALAAYHLRRARPGPP